MPPKRPLSIGPTELHKGKVNNVRIHKDASAQNMVAAVLTEFHEIAKEKG